MNFIKKYFRTREVKKLEADIALDYSQAIQKFLATPIIASLQVHLIRQNEIEQKLDENNRENEKLANSRLWGNRFSANGYYTWNDELKAELKDRLAKIQEIYDLLGFEITEETFDKLKKEADFYLKQNSILNKSAREIIVLENNPSLISERQMVQAAAIAGGLGVAFHVGASYMQSVMVYDALRNVNSNFEALSNVEIWSEMMLLNLINPDSYQGMVNLAKGAYFEQLVANDTGGILHANFNEPGTDMTLDGEAVQLKATDSETVLDSIAPSISVIATSELASNTSAIDSGYSNEELTTTTENALGGDILDTSGGLMDGAIVFSGAIGVFASLKGVCAAGEYLEKNPRVKTDDSLKDLEKHFSHLAEASIIGLEVAVVSTFNALPYAWNLMLTLVRWTLNTIHIILYPFIKIFG